MPDGKRDTLKFGQRRSKREGDGRAAGGKDEKRVREERKQQREAEERLHLIGKTTQRSLFASCAGRGKLRAWPPLLSPISPSFPRNINRTRKGDSHTPEESGLTNARAVFRRGVGNENASIFERAPFPDSMTVSLLRSVKYARDVKKGGIQEG